MYIENRSSLHSEMRKQLHAGVTPGQFEMDGLKLIEMRFQNGPSTVTGTMVAWSTLKSSLTRIANLSPRALKPLRRATFRRSHTQRVGV